MTEKQVDAAIELAERVARGEVKPSTLRKTKPIVATMVLIWLWRRQPALWLTLPESTRSILWARVGFDFGGEDETKKDKRRQRKQ